MTTHDQDPVQGWQDALIFFEDFARKKHWEFLNPMVGLVAWAAAFPTTSKLYPGTSHAALTVSLTPGYNPEMPFFSLAIAYGEFQFELWQAVGQRLESRFSTIEQVKETFIEFVEKLKSL